MSGPHRRPQQRKRGTVLFFALAILGLLSLFGITFVQLVKFERAASNNYTDAVRARMLARAGIRRAVVELQDLAGRRHYSDPVADGWKYDLQAPSSLTDQQRRDLDLPLNLMLTTSPSFKVTNLGLVKGTIEGNRECDGEPHTGPRCSNDPLMYRAPLAISGYLGQTYQNGMDVYKLKVLDTASQLNLNHPDDATAQRMIKNLIRAAADEDTTWTITDGAANAIAAHVVLNRPTSGFRSKAEVQALITVDPARHSSTCPCEVNAPANGGLGLNGVTAANRVSEERWFQTLRDRVTTHSWVDDKVIRPWNLNPDLPGSHVHWRQATRNLPLMRRSPVNLNTASKPVLVALFADLEARNDYGTFKVGYATAGSLADQIIAWRSASGAASTTIPGTTLDRGPFKSWVDFETWLDHHANLALPTIQTPARGAAPYIPAPANDANFQAVKTPAMGWDDGMVPNKFPYGVAPGAGERPVSPTWCALLEGQGVKDMIKAQLNPNTMLNKFGQGANHGGRNQFGMPVARLVDKSDLVHMSTEGCFDAMGVFEITSLGMVLRRDARQAKALAEFLGVTADEDELAVLAGQTLQVVIKVYDVSRYTTQADFEKFRAMMAPGDFIPDYQAWRNLPGVNRTNEAIMSSLGWPSMITQPVYSVVRDDLELHNIAGGHTPAQYDGHMTLTNLLGVQAQPWDFIAGFARGTTDAFKCRVWWDPKDQNPFPSGANNSLSPGWPYPESGGQLPFDSTNPSHPAGSFPPPSVGAAQIDDWYAGNLPGVPGPDFTELDSLCSPIPGANPKASGRVSQEPSPLDAKLGETVTDGEWWHEGSSLWNNGVVVGPRRTDANGNPIALAYNGDNINLYRASSIRVWVQPLADPYLREEEVLLSFIGSNGSNVGNAGGIKRDVGWRVVKRALATSVSIALQACPSNNPDNGTNGDGNPYSNPNNKNINRFAWHHQDNVKWRDVVEIDVTPDTKTRFKDRTFKALNPLEPEWLPNTWHWLVVNYGYARDNNDPASASLGFAQFDMSIQVDMRPTQPPRAYDPAEGTGRIAFMGDTGLSDGYGELHGHEHVRTDDNPMQPLGTARGINNDPIRLPNSSSTHIWLEPRPLGDYYNCRKGAVTLEEEEEEYLDVVTWDATNAEYVTSQGINFPPQSFDHQVVLRYPDGSERNMRWVGDGTGMFGNWTYNFLTGPPGDPGTQFDYGADGVPGTADDVPMDIVLRYRIARPASESPYCKAVETTPGQWTGASMQKFAVDSAAGLNPPDPGNGDNQCVAQALIHGRPIVTCGGGLQCWTVTNVRSTGQQAVISVPGGLSTIPPRMVCDGCRGCENCDVDAPLFVGGEPESVNNLVNNAGVMVAAPIDRDTMSYAVFDNLVIKNLREFEARTDFASKGGFIDDPANPGYEIPALGAGGTPNAPVDWFEDRFFEQSTAAEHFDSVPDADPSQGFGATYRRGLLELIGQRTRLGSVTWTSYPSSDGTLQFEVSMFRLSGKDSGGLDTWRGDNRDILTQATLIPDAAGQPGRSQILNAAQNRVVGYKDGLTFGSNTLYDGLGDDLTPYEIMMLGVQLGNLYEVGAGGAATTDLMSRQSFGFHTSTPGAPLAVLPSTQNGLPTPIMETPVFEDITINFLRETPQILYAEEGVNE